MEAMSAQISPANLPVDTDDLLNRCLGRMDIVERILNRFQSALDDDLDQLEQALQNIDPDAKQVARIAHRIKGSSLSVSAYGLGDCASHIEESANSQQLDEIQVHVDRLKEMRTLFQEACTPASKDNPVWKQSAKSFTENTSCES